MNGKNKGELLTNCKKIGFLQRFAYFNGQILYMTKQLTTYAQAIVIMLLFSSCYNSVGRYAYSPSPANITYFKEKGDSKVSATISSGPNDGFSVPKERYNRGYDIQAAYALSNHWFVGASYYNRREKESAGPSDGFSYRNIYDTSTISYKRHLTEFGGGFFVPFDSRSIGTFSIYGTLGFGKYSLTDVGFDNALPYTRMYQNAFTKYGLQASFNYMPTDYVRASFALKYAIVRYGNATTTYNSNELFEFDLDRVGNNTFRFLEPTFNVQLGLPQYKWVKLDLAVTICSDQEYVTKRKSNASIGLCFDISKLKKSK